VHLMLDFAGPDYADHDVGGAREALATETLVKFATQLS
jgi:hypothetical protein